MAKLAQAAIAASQNRASLEHRAGVLARDVQPVVDAQRLATQAPLSAFGDAQALEQFGKDGDLKGIIRTHPIAIRDNVARSHERLQLAEAGVQEVGLPRRSSDWSRMSSMIRETLCIISRTTAERIRRSGTGSDDSARQLLRDCQVVGSICFWPGTASGAWGPFRRWRRRSRPPARRAGGSVRRHEAKAGDDLGGLAIRLLDGGVVHDLARQRRRAPPAGRAM